ncbi:MAG: hypothetical protein OHK0039_24480 [Bacteroidia bacterium]
MESDTLSHPVTGSLSTVPEACWDPIFVPKPKAASSYRNLVDALDELALNGAHKYAIDAFTSEDSLLMAGADVGHD